MDFSQISIDSWLQNEEDLMKQLETTSWSSFPSLNYTDFNALKEGQFVKFIGMVQDMKSPEYYLESYVSLNRETNEKTRKSGKFKEFIHYDDNEVMEDVVRKELQTFYVISTPGENNWVKEFNNGEIRRNSSEKVEKRRYDEEMETNSEFDNQNKKFCGKNENEMENSVNSRNFSREFLLNFPLENEEGKGCLAKIYKDGDKIKLNELCEFVGFLSFDPKLSQFTGEDFENIEIQINNPPPSLIPRLHCVHYRKLKFYNPLIENSELSLSQMPTEKIKTIRKELIILFTQLCFGDEIAAEYLLCNLISEIYVRSEVLSLGKFTLNLSNAPVNLKLGEKLNEIFELILTKNHYFELTIDNLNNKEFIPKKDYEINRLNTGLLQLTGNTNLILDETKLEVGKLETSGINAVQTLKNLIETQKISYDFNYYPIEFECDLPILIISEGKSMFPSDFHVILKPEQSHLETFNEIFDAAKQFLRRPELLDDIRKYLTLCRLIKYEISDNSHQLIEQKFVEIRSNGGNSNDLHNFLILNRLICLSYGKTNLDQETCEIASKLENNRKQREIL